MENFYKNINKLLNQYIGGEIFFDKLDDSIKFNEDILDELWELMLKKAPPEKYYVIASGEMGLRLYNNGYRIDQLVTGGLRKGKKINKINILKGHEYIFIDDSYFSGKTMEVIKQEVEKQGGILNTAFVAYDGSNTPYKGHNIYSLYRYYDYYSITGKEIKK